MSIVVGISLLLFGCGIVLDFGEFDVSKAPRPDGGGDATVTRTFLVQIDDLHPNRIRLHRGEARAIPIKVSRNGAEGDIAITVEGSPLEGITFDPAVVKANATEASLVVHASETAPFTVTERELKIRATPTLGGSDTGPASIYISVRPTELDPSYADAGVLLVTSDVSPDIVASAFDSADDRLYVLTAPPGRDLFTIHRTNGAGFVDLELLRSTPSRVTDVALYSNSSAPEKSKLCVLLEDRLWVFPLQYLGERDPFVEEIILPRVAERILARPDDGTIAVLTRSGLPGEEHLELLLHVGEDGGAEGGTAARPLRPLGDSTSADPRLEADGDATLVMATEFSTDNRPIVHVARVLPNGQLDQGFGVGGAWSSFPSPSSAADLTGLRASSLKVVPQQANGIQPAAHVIISGLIPAAELKVGRPILIGLTAAGQLEKSFGTEGFVSRSFLRDNAAAPLTLDRELSHLYVGMSDVREDLSSLTEFLEAHAYQVGERTIKVDPFFGNVFPRGELEGVFRIDKVLTSLPIPPQYLSRADRMHVDRSGKLLIVGARNPDERFPTPGWFVLRVIP